jgi:cytochrome P450
MVLGTAIMDHLPSSAARDTHKYYLASCSKLAERMFLEEEAKSSKKEIRRDIFHYLFSSKDPETGLGLSEQKLQADASLLIAAGSDGVALTVSAALFYLLRNPATLDILTKELQSAFSHVDEVSRAKMNELPYLQAVLEEAMRLAPSVPSAFPREVLDGGIKIDDLHVPAGLTVGVSAYAIHHNEAYYPDSFAFQPERWLGDKDEVRLARNAFLTFGAGPYNCIGKNVAILASKLVLAKLIFAYEIRATNGMLTGGGGPGQGRGREREDEYQLLDCLVSYRSGPWVQLKARET